MELQFKDVSGKDNIGDFTWIHQSGRQALIADLVSGCDVSRGIDLLSSWLTVNQTNELFVAEQVIEDLHQLFFNNNLHQRRKFFNFLLIGSNTLKKFIANLL